MDARDIAEIADKLSYAEKRAIHATNYGSRWIVQRTTTNGGSGFEGYWFSFTAHQAAWNYENLNLSPFASRAYVYGPYPEKVRLAVRQHLEVKP
jgi:hypothetical protein